MGGFIHVGHFLGLLLGVWSQQIAKERPYNWKTLAGLQTVLFPNKKNKIIPGVTVGGNFQLFLFWRIDNKPPLKTQDKKERCS